MTNFSTMFQGDVDMMGFLASIEVPEEAINVFKDFRDTVEREHWHPNSNLYRIAERDCLLQMGIITGRALERNEE